MKASLNATVRYYMRLINGNYSFEHRMRYVHLSWFFDYLGQRKTPAEAYKAVMDTLEFMQKKEEEFMR